MPRPPRGQDTDSKTDPHESGTDSFTSDHHLNVRMILSAK